MKKRKVNMDNKDIKIKYIKMKLRQYVTDFDNDGKVYVSFPPKKKSHFVDKHIEVIPNPISLVGFDVISIIVSYKGLKYEFSEFSIYDYYIFNIAERINKLIEENI